MSLRIAGGSRRSRIITCPDKGVRPTTNRVKEAIFSALGVDFEGLSVLDIFAGSGNLGIEALSRGAASATFVELNRKNAATISGNLNALELAQQSKVVISPAKDFIKNCRESYDLIFMDPPYDKALASETAPLAYNLLKIDGILIVEHSPNEAVDMEAWKSRSYGDTVITYIRRTK